MKSTNTNALPTINLEGLERLVFAYGGEDDIAYLHIGGPRKAITVQADDSWYLRVADGEVVGLELHGLRRAFLTTPLFSAVFKPVIDEMEALSGASFFGDEGFRAEGPPTELPKTFRLLILLIGQGLARYQIALQEEFDGRRSLVAAS